MGMKLFCIFYVSGLQNLKTLNSKVGKGHDLLLAILEMQRFSSYRGHIILILNNSM